MIDGCSRSQRNNHSRRLPQKNLLYVRKRATVSLDDRMTS
jgi:hypothetical protein